MAEQASEGRGKETIEREFVNDEGEPTPRAQEDSHTVVLRIGKIGAELRCELSKVFNGSLPAPCVGRAAAAFGVSTSVGNAGNSAMANAAKAIHKGSSDAAVRRAALDQVNPETALNAMQDRWNRFVSGEWAGEGGFGPGTSLMLEAVVEYRRLNGKETSEEDKQRFRELFKNEAEKKKYMSSQKFRAVYEKMRAERAVAGAAEKPDESASLLS